jgi:hypothetical protein
MKPLHRPDGPERAVTLVSTRAFVRLIHLKMYGAHVNPKRCLTPPECPCGAVHPCPAVN